jgi:hypothetical protein
MKTEEWSIALHFLTSALDGDKWSTSRLGRFTPEKESPVPVRYEAGWDPERAWTLWGREKAPITAWIRIPAVELVARLYTEWANPATYYSTIENIFSIRSLTLFIVWTRSLYEVFVLQAVWKYLTCSIGTSWRAEVMVGDQKIKIKSRWDVAAQIP